MGKQQKLSLVIFYGSRTIRNWVIRKSHVEIFYSITVKNHLVVSAKNQDIPHILSVLSEKDVTIDSTLEGENDLL